jgi:hypothetical protein
MLIHFFAPLIAMVPFRRKKKQQQRHGPRKVPPLLLKRQRRRRRRRKWPLKTQQRMPRPRRKRRARKHKVTTDDPTKEQPTPSQERKFTPNGMVHSQEVLWAWSGRV